MIPIEHVCSFRRFDDGMGEEHKEGSDRLGE
jgi:hypothetical protein